MSGIHRLQSREITCWLCDRGEAVIKFACETVFQARFFDEIGQVIRIHDPAATWTFLKVEFAQIHAG